MTEVPDFDGTDEDSAKNWYKVPLEQVPMPHVARMIHEVYSPLLKWLRQQNEAGPIRYNRDDPAPRKGYRDDELLNRVLSRCRVSGLAGCYEWQLSGTAKGYGRMRVDGKLYLPHRVAAYAAGIVDSLSDPTRNVCVLHECDNPRCCRPEHLKAGTMSQNMKDCVARGRHKISKR